MTKPTLSAILAVATVACKVISTIIEVKGNTSTYYVPITDGKTIRNQQIKVYGPDHDGKKLAKAIAKKTNKAIRKREKSA